MFLKAFVYRVEVLLLQSSHYFSTKSLFGSCRRITSCATKFPRSQQYKGRNESVHCAVMPVIENRPRLFPLMWCERADFLSHVRGFSFSRVNLQSELSATELKKEIEHLTDQFIEARELLDDARESMGSVYFSEDMKEAQESVTQTLAKYRQLMEQLTENQKQEVLQKIGLKMEELKAQEDAIRESLLDDH